MKHFNSLFVLILVVLSVLVSGCVGWGSEVQKDMETDIMEDIPIIGWFWQDHPSKQKNTSKTDVHSTPNYTSTLPDIPKDTRCPGEHQYWNMQYYTCMCESDYYMQDGVCLPKSSRECTLDRDCSPNGQLSVCYSATAKRVYYCDLNKYKCVGGKGVGTIVDCKAEYGPNYKCLNGNCVAS